MGELSSYLPYTVYWSRRPGSVSTPSSQLQPTLWAGCSLCGLLLQGPLFPFPFGSAWISLFSGTGSISLFSGTGSPRGAFLMFVLVNRMCTGCPKILSVIPWSSCFCPWSHVCNTGHSEDPIAQSFRQEMIIVPDFTEVERTFGSPQYYRKR